MFRINFNKRAQFFALYLVFLTLFMIGAVLLIYYAQSKSVDNALVSPASVYFVQDENFVAEVYEQGVLLEVYEEVFSSGLSDDLIDNFEEEFCNRFVSYDEQSNFFRKFLFKDIFYNGMLEVDLGGVFDNNLNNAQTNFCFNLYDFGINGNDFVVNRNLVMKKIKLVPLESYSRDEIVFPVEFLYNFDKKYLIKRDDLGVYIEEVE